MIPRGLTSKDTQRRLSLECTSLRDLVDKLRQDMLLCKNETQKVKDQLQCLIYLVKRAWSGDYIAAVHVSNIVGVPPPEYKKKEPERVNVTPQPDPISNWARLCIGLLNKMYQEEELELRASQLMYLQDREGYLDDQLSHSDLVRHQSNMALLKTNTYQLLQAKEEEERKERQEKMERLDKQKQKLQLQYQKKHPHHSHLYRKPSRESIQQASEINTDSLFVVKPVGTNRPSSGVRKHEQVFKEEKGEFSDEFEEVSDDAVLVANYDAYDSCSAYPKIAFEDNKPNKQSRSFTNSRPKSGIGRSPTKSRAKSAGNTMAATQRTRQRPVHSAKPTTTSDRRKTIDLIESDLKTTTKTLQDRLGISKQGMV